MSIRDFFTLGSKWIGVYCLALAVGELFKAFPLTFTYVPQLRQSPPVFQASHWLSFLSPIGVLTTGVYLIRDGSHICDFAFHGDGETTIKDSKDFFDVAIKLYGLYLVAGAIPSCIWLLANVLIVLRAAPYLSVDNELEGIQSYLLPVLTTLGLGTCCLILSSRLTGLAFHRAESSAP
jgi:hypothetical protein